MIKPRWDRTRLSEWGLAAFFALAAFFIAANLLFAAKMFAGIDLFPGHAGSFFAAGREMATSLSG